jgi:hypothetical protein
MRSQLCFPSGLVSGKEVMKRLERGLPEPALRVLEGAI